jgi:hypothetical protein
MLSFLQNEPNYCSSLHPLASLSGAAGIKRDCIAVVYSRSDCAAPILAERTQFGRQRASGGGLTGNRVKESRKK